MATEAHDTATQALPTPGAGPQMRMVEVALIEESLTNPRKHFDQAKLAELAESIKATGVHQPILLRPLPGTRLAETFGFRRQGAPLPAYELVAGARRLRACRLAKVAEVPAMIRELTDEQALEIQVIENLQREDVTALEEAEGYEALMKHGHADADQVAAKIGKSRSYVYARLKLLDLCQQAREALREGKIDFSRGLLIARIPDEGMQIKALQFCTRTDWQGDAPGYRECARHVQDEYMLRLDKARFPIADASLLPAAGSCAACPKRTGANPDLFKDVDSADVCTDPQCYRAKEDAHTALMVAEAQAKGQTVIAGQDAAELAYDAYNHKLKGYKRLDSAEDSPTGQPLRKIIGKQMEAEGIKPTLIENPRKRGELVAALPNEVALRLLKTVEGQAKASKAVAAEVKELVKTKEAKALEKAKARYEQAWRDALIDRAWKAINTECIVPLFSLDVHRYIVLREIASLSADDAAALADILDLGKVAPHSALIDFAKATASPDFLMLLVIMQRDASANHYAHNRPKNEGLMLVSGVVFKDHLDALIEELQAQAREQYLPKPAKPAAPEGASTPHPAAQANPARGKGKAPKAKAEAAPKTTPAQAQAAIAAALRAAEDQNQAPAAQGNEAPPDPSVGDAPAPGGLGGAGAQDGAAVEAAKPLKEGATVRVRPHDAGPKNAPYIGQTGTLRYLVGQRRDTWRVAFPTGTARKKEAVESFNAAHLEVV
ncbi:MAG: ParB/RepB/Spo0J family partition protein [Burkholderiales bacterium]|nr:ParB/RepB/Spo0J family partition protein [Burkholderiales bacterium]